MIDNFFYVNDRQWIARTLALQIAEYFGPVGFYRGPAENKQVKVVFRGSTLHERFDELWVNDQWYRPIEIQSSKSGKPIARARGHTYLKASGKENDEYIMEVASSWSQALQSKAGPDRRVRRWSRWRICGWHATMCGF